MPRKAGQPAFKPTAAERKLVEQMTACGIPQDSLCLVVRDGIDEKTLRKHFRRELDTSATKANAKVAQTLFSKAMGRRLNTLAMRSGQSKMFTRNNAR